MRLLIGFALAAGVIAGCRAEPQAVSAPPAATAARVAPSGLPLIPLQVQTRRGVRSFTVEVAQTPEEQAQGLMFRERLAPDAGMLFPFAPPRHAGFYMKNTLIALDMIFIRADGTIARIAANTVPGSLDNVASGEPVAAVLEIAGGRSAQLGIAPGDRVRWPAGPRG